MENEYNPHDWHCLDCDEICDIDDLRVDEDDNILCPNCGSGEIVEL